MSETLDELKRLVDQKKANALRVRRLRDRAIKLAEALPEEFEKLASITATERSTVVNFPETLQDYLEDRLAAIRMTAETLKTESERCLTQIEDLDLRAFVEAAEGATQNVLDRIEADAFPALENLLDTALGEAISSLEGRAGELAAEWKTSWETTDTVISDAQTELSDLKDRLEDAFTEFTNVDVDDVLREAAQNMLGKFGDTVSGIIQRIESLKSDIKVMVDRLNAIMEVFRRAREAKDVAQASAGTGLELVSEILVDLTDTLKSV
ncbi:MAG: hypothetical protein AAF950_16940 [Pseudomonadota bacterium]